MYSVLTVSGVLGELGEVVFELGLARLDLVGQQVLLVEEEDDGD